jgi:hypothetical protein
MLSSECLGSGRPGREKEGRGGGRTKVRKDKTGPAKETGMLVLFLNIFNSLACETTFGAG